MFKQATTWIDEGMVKRIRGVTFSTRVSPQFGNRMVFSARGVFNRLLPDVHIFTDHRSGLASGRCIFNIKSFVNRIKCLGVYRPLSLAFIDKGIVNDSTFDASQRTISTLMPLKEAASFSRSIHFSIS